MTSVLLGITRNVRYRLQNSQRRKRRTIFHRDRKERAGGTEGCRAHEPELHERHCTRCVVHVDDIFAVGEKERCDQFGRDLNQLVPVKNLGELRWYSGCFYERLGERNFDDFSTDIR